MSLPPSSRQYEGRLLRYRPGYGWGWSRSDASGQISWFDYARIEEAGAFQIRAHRIFSFRGEWRGLVGRVEQAGHLFDGLWVVTYTMTVGDYNFTDNLCPRWDIELGAAEPGDEDWPAIPAGSPTIIGYGVLSVPDGGAAPGGHEDAVALTPPPSPPALSCPSPTDTITPTDGPSPRQEPP